MMQRHSLLCIVLHTVRRLGLLVVLLFRVLSPTKIVLSRLPLSFQPLTFHAGAFCERQAGKSGPSFGVEHGHQLITGCDEHLS